MNNFLLNSELFLYHVIFLYMSPLLLLRMSEEIRVTMMAHLLDVWINITEVLSAVWEHKTLVWFWTKTPRSNDRGRFVRRRGAQSGLILCML